MGFTLLIGILGATLILIAFFLDELEYKAVMQNTVVYNVINVVGAASLGVYAYSLSAWPFVVLNAIWAFVALYKMICLLKKQSAR